MISPSIHLLRGATQARLVLVRPGATSFDEQGRLKGSLDMPLCESGIEQAKNLASELSSLRLDAIYTAPCRSAIQTADHLANGRDVRPKVIEAFRNLDYGLWHGKLIDEIRRTQPRLFRSMCDRPESVCPPGGESMQAAFTRTQKALRKILKRGRDRMVGLVVPDPLASVIAAELSGEALPQLWSVATDEGSWQLIDAKLTNV
ncbi:MAG: histidine phosphatase family protein [Planctomycetota bacterium]